MPVINDLWKRAQIQEIDEAVIAMERNGFMLDLEYLKVNAERARDDERQILDSLAQNMARAGVPPLPGWEDIWTSPKQLVSLIHDEHCFNLEPSPVKFKGKVKVELGERSTDKTALEYLGVQLGRLMEREPTSRFADSRRGVAECLEGIIRLRQTRSSIKYLEKLPRYVGPDGFVHPVCGAASDDDDRVGALTGRFAMKNPEGQQIPKNKKKDRYGLRRSFIAPPGQQIIAADFSALEAVILANLGEWLFGDTLLLDLTAPGQDIHAYNAHRIFGVLLGWKTEDGRKIADYPQQELYKTDPALAWFRDLIKAVWYGLMYRKSAYGFGYSLRDAQNNLLGKTRAQEIVDAMYEAVPTIPKFHAWVDERVKRTGGMISPDGRRVDYTPTIERGEWGLEAAQRAGSNFPMQAYGAGIVGAAMVALNKCPILKKTGAKMQLQVHDEFVFRAPKSACWEVGELVQYHMEETTKLKNLRVEVGIADTWEDA